jgi:hypothetical protein
VEATPEPEPVVEAIPEPVVETIPEPVVETIPEPEPEPVVEAIPEPEPEPVVEAIPQPEQKPAIPQGFQFKAALFEIPKYSGGRRGMMKKSKSYSDSSL